MTLVNYLIANQFLGWGWFVPILVCLGVNFLYIFGFASSMLESVIEGKVVNMSDSIKGIICFWVFPFGVWQIQPAVHRVLKSRQQTTLVNNNGL